MPYNVRKHLTLTQIIPDCLAEKLGNLTMRMSNHEIDLFSKILKEGLVYLEYGSGGSTKAAAHCPSIAQITSVESDAVYVEAHVLDDPKVQEAVKTRRLNFILVDIGPTGNWGYPLDISKSYLWPNYVLSPYLYGPKPDVILIDGRFRVASSLVSMLEAPQARLLIHDYTGRPNYHILERFITITDTVDSLICCRRGDDFDELAAKKIISQYLYQPGDGAPHYPV